MKLTLVSNFCLAASVAFAPLACSAKSADSTAGPSCAMAAGPGSVPLVQVAADPPSPQGGAIAPGSYVLTDYSLYTGASGKSGPTGTSVSAVYELDATSTFKSWFSASNPATSGGSYANHGTTLTLFLTCPQSRVDHLSYSASSTSIQVFNPAGGGGTLVSTYTLQCQAGTFPGMGC
jgi:hypothetical protein